MRSFLASLAVLCLASTSPAQHWGGGPTQPLPVTSPVQPDGHTYTIQMIYPAGLRSAGDQWGFISDSLRGVLGTYGITSQNGYYINFQDDIYGLYRVGTYDYWNNSYYGYQEPPPPSQATLNVPNGNWPDTMGARWGLSYVPSADGFIDSNGNPVGTKMHWLQVVGVNNEAMALTAVDASLLYPGQGGWAGFWFWIDGARPNGNNNYWNSPATIMYDQAAVAAGYSLADAPFVGYQWACVQVVFYDYVCWYEDNFGNAIPSNPPLTPGITNNLKILHYGVTWAFEVTKN